MVADPIKLTDTNRLVRDPFSKGLMSVDTTGLGAYRAQRRSSAQLQALETDINTVRSELEVMKQMLATALANIHNA